MFKRFAFIITIIIAGLGICFIGLDILDIAEDYRLYLPIAALNTVFITAMAVLVAYLAARSFINTGSLGMLVVGGAILAFGAGILIYGWFTHAVLEVRLTVYDSTFFMAAMMHLVGVILLKSKLSLPRIKLWQKRAIVLLSYLIIFAIIAVVTSLLYQGVLPGLTISRDLFHAISAALCIVAVIICFKIYLKSHNDFYYWYSLGLILFTLGILFMAQGALESRVAWLGRAAQYIGGIYFLVAVIGAHQKTRTQEVQ